MILVCAATARELGACLEPRGIWFEGIAARTGRSWARPSGGNLYAVTGVGIPLTLTRLLPLAASLKPDLILNVGIAGAYPDSGFSIGDLAAAESESFGDLGMETPGAEAFLPLASFPWADDDYRRPLPLTLEPLQAALPTHPDGNGARFRPRPARGCTVNQCTGREETGRKRRDLFGAGFETMEGAAVALAGRELGIPVCQVRAISNFASARDMRPENVTLALGNLGVYMAGLLGRLEAVQDAKAAVDGKPAGAGKGEA
ncbi:MAG: futalosine hydrolase [Fibrobacteres bacterium]|nr:futalosine hydrolase [Fibrobacterota bacterium]